MNFKLFIKIIITVIAVGAIAACNATRPTKFTNLSLSEVFKVISGLTQQEQFGCANVMGFFDDSGSMTPAQTGMSQKGQVFAQAIEAASQGSQVVDFTGSIFKVSNYRNAANPGALVPAASEIHKTKLAGGTFNPDFTANFSSALAPGITPNFGREHTLASWYYTLLQNIEAAAGGDIPFMPKDPNGNCANFFILLTDENLQSAPLIDDAAAYLSGISYNNTNPECTFTLGSYSFVSRPCPAYGTESTQGAVGKIDKLMREYHGLPVGAPRNWYVLPGTLQYFESMKATSSLMRLRKTDPASYTAPFNINDPDVNTVYNSWPSVQLAGEANDIATPDLSPPIQKLSRAFDLADIEYGYSQVFQRIQNSLYQVINGYVLKRTPDPNLPITVNLIRQDGSARALTLEIDYNFVGIKGRVLELVPSLLAEVQNSQGGTNPYVDIAISYTPAAGQP